ncbi:MAG: hypothetical protein PVI92_06815 [Chromatiales bacterium]|jgi:GMP synthase PP-ATPase subunit
MSQAFAVFLAVSSVGVFGEALSYEYKVLLRAVKTIKFMTAKLAHNVTNISKTGTLCLAVCSILRF